MTNHPQRKPQPTMAERKRLKEQRQAQARQAKEQRLATKPANKLAGLRYDYGQIAEADRETVQRAALDIRSRLKRTVEDMIEIGRILNEIQDVLHYQQFYEWAGEEFGLSRGSVFEFSRIAIRFGGEKRSIIEHIFSPTVLRRLAAVSVPNDAVEAVIAAASATSKPLRVQDAMAIVKPFLPPKPPKLVKPKQLPGPVAEPEPDAIDAEYTVVPDEEEAQAIAEVEAERAEEERLRLAINRARDEQLTFAEWWAMMPKDEMSLRDHLAILELAKGSATRLRNVRPALYNAVTDLLPSISRLIHKTEQELKNE